MFTMTDIRYYGQGRKIEIPVDVCAREGLVGVV